MSVDVEVRFREVWLFCMMDHKVGTLSSGPCDECIRAYAKDGPPDGNWNSPA